VDILDRLLGHHAWATQSLLLRAKELDDNQLDQFSNFAKISLRSSFDILIGNMERWSDLIIGRAPYEHPRRQDQTVDGLLRRLTAAAQDLADASRSVRDRNGWDTTFVNVYDSPPTRHTFGGGVAHILTHSSQNRGQCLLIMRELGLKNLPDADALAWESQTFGWS
jgi:uncharacterized damage-inducible protein DinB